MMAHTDYKLCDICDKEAYYEGYINYANSKIKVLCSDCAKSYIIVIVDKEDLIK